MIISEWFVVEYNYPSSAQLQNVRNYIIDVHLPDKIGKEQLFNGGRVQWSQSE